MIIIGIDPGSRRIGYGLIEQEARGTLTLREAGLLPITAKNDIDAMRETKEAMDDLLRRTAPDMLGIEKLFFMKNKTTAIAVAQARGVILLAAAERGVPIREFTPNEVKAGFTGYGGADKKAVAKMVRLTLGEAARNLIDDATDAVAIAVCAAHTRPEGAR